MRIFSTKWRDKKFELTQFNAHHPIGSKLRRKHLLQRISIQDVEDREMLNLDPHVGGDGRSLAFGWRNDDWEQFKKQVNPTRVWSFSLIDVESEWRISQWQGYVEKRWFGWGALIVTYKQTEFPNNEKQDKPFTSARSENPLWLGETFDIPEFLKRDAEQ